MTSKEKLIEKLGLKKEQFEPKPKEDIPTEERMSALEDAFAELCEVVFND